ncbi:MAG: enamine deaminase RidA [Cellvibrionales bacterium]|nr:MAG: enamine deaminase RidA [Cellvibrionales bacterium]
MQALLIKTVLAISILVTMSTLVLSKEANHDSDIQLTIINPPELYDPAPNGYSHAIVVKSGSRIAYIAGQGGEDGNGKLHPGFANQVRQAYANLRTALDAVGAKPNQVAKITTYVVDYDQSMLSILSQVLKDTFGDALPAQTLTPVPRLALDGMLFEVDAVAVLD